MKKQFLFILSCLIFLQAFMLFGPEALADSYMSNKTEIPVNLEVSGAEAICQTEDGYIWIAQYSSLTRYDSRDFVTYKNFEYEGQDYTLINVRALEPDGNTLYVGTSEHVFVYKDYHFEPLVLNPGIIVDLELDRKNQLLYISTQNNGGIIYDIVKGVKKTIPGTEGKSIRDIALGIDSGSFYYQADEGAFDNNGNLILDNPRLLEIYSHHNTLYMAEDTGVIHRYDMRDGKMLDDLIIPDQVNKMLYSDKDQLMFVACEKNGIYVVDFSTGEPVISLAGDLDNRSQLVDLMIDYEDNLWVASHYIGASGVSVIVKDALSELLYDDPIWQALNAPPDFYRNVYAIEKYGNILYIVAASRIYRYDLISNEILPDNAIMQAIDEYAEARTQEGRAQGDSNFAFVYSPKDAEVFKDKIYFAIYGIGLVEYDPATDKVVIYDQNYISDHLGKLVDDPDIAVTNTIRSMRSFDDYLVLGYTRGLMRFDGTTFSVMNLGTNVLYINKTKDGKIMYDRTKGLYTVDDDFTAATEIPTVTDITGNRLKFLVDGDYIYYTLNSRLFRLNTKEDSGLSSEIAIPYIKGSIVELAKVRCSDSDGKEVYKYVIASQNQLYITDSLEGERLTDYVSYDSTNGLQPIIANTSGYYDEADQKYYLQSTNGIFVYDFSLTRDVPAPVRIAISSVDLDGIPYYGSNIPIDKNAYRVTFNLSILGFRPNNGYTIYYRLNGVDTSFAELTDDSRSMYYTNIPGGTYDFEVYVRDEYGQESNRIAIHLEKEKKIIEQWWFWTVLILLGLGVILLFVLLFFRHKSKQAEKRQKELMDITVQSIEAIAKTIDAKDEYTNGHSLRVGIYSKLIAQEMGMSPDDVTNIYYIALLHDIGKIGVSNNVLNKPGRLTDAEFAEMKSHTTRGAVILEGITTIPDIVAGAKNHHEKYDGSGYPEKLKGEDIPFVARIICCADCFDAMATARVYKPAYPLEKILSEFKRCSGTQFDPQIASVVVRMIEEGKLKPVEVEETVLGSDGKTHRVQRSESPVKGTSKQDPEAAFDPKLAHAVIRLIEEGKLMPVDPTKPAPGSNDKTAQSSDDKTAPGNGDKTAPGSDDKTVPGSGDKTDSDSNDKTPGDSRSEAPVQDK